MTMFRALLIAMVCLCLCLQDAQVSSGGQRRRRRVRHHPVRRRPALRGPGVQGPSVLATALPEPFCIACLLCSAPHTCFYPRILLGLCYPSSRLSPNMSCPDLPTYRRSSTGSGTSIASLASGPSSRGACCSCTSTSSAASTADRRGERTDRETDGGTGHTR